MKHLHLLEEESFLKDRIKGAKGRFATLKKRYAIYKLNKVRNQLVKYRTHAWIGSPA